MTGPNPIPDLYRPHDKPGCSFIVAAGQRCGVLQTETLSHLGRRCAEHPPVFEPELAVEIAVSGWPDTAAAYCRWSA